MTETVQELAEDIAVPDLDTQDLEALARKDPMGEAVTLIDGKLSQLPARNIVSANEVADLLLDIRVLLSEARDNKIVSNN